MWLAFLNQVLSYLWFHFFLFSLFFPWLQTPSIYTFPVNIFCFAYFAGILGGRFGHRMLVLFESGAVFVKWRLGGSTL